jgi:DNA repair protein RecO (recombination protein O)
MNRTYKATGINLKAMPMGESDRLLTILTSDSGLIRAVAPGSRKHQSRLGGRSDLFVINDWLVIKGKGLDKVVQAETVRTFPGLSQHLGRLTASQYLAEVALFMALDDNSQADLYHLLIEHLERIETSRPEVLLAALSHGLYHLLALAGVAPEVHRCCVSQREIVPNLLDSDWKVGFSGTAGGLVEWSELGQVARMATGSGGRQSPRGPGEVQGDYGRSRQPSPALGAIEVALLQQLSKPELITTMPILPVGVTPPPLTHQEFWSRIEQLLRQYAQDYFERPIRSATLIDVCFATV